MTDIRAQYPAIYTAPTLDALETALERDGEAWYTAELEGVQYRGNYDGIPTFGARTAVVESLVNASGNEGDILSWDTTSDDPAAHRYLMRETSHRGTRFLVYTHAEILERFERAE
jgi:hypothetical protein